MSSFLGSRIASVGHALRGLRFLVASQPNAKIHAVASVIVVALGFALDLARGDWLWLVVAMGAVWSAEAMNTAVEELADVVSPDRHPKIGHAKDVAAGAVLATAIAAAVIGVLVLGPPLLAALG